MLLELCRSYNEKTIIKYKNRFISLDISINELETFPLILKSCKN